MSIARWHPAAALFVLGAFPGAPVAAQQALFSSDTIVELRLEAPFSQLTRRDAEGRQPGRLIVPTGTGADTLSVSLSPLGACRSAKLHLRLGDLARESGNILLLLVSAPGARSLTPPIVEDEWRALKRVT